MGSNGRPRATPKSQKLIPNRKNFRLPDPAHTPQEFILGFLRFSFFFRLVNATTIFNGKEPIWPLTQRHLMNATKPDLQSIRSSTPNIIVQSRHWVTLCVRWTILHMNIPVTPSTFLVNLPTPVLCFNVFVSRPPLLYGCACGDCPGSWNDAIRIRAQIKLSTSK